MIIEREVLGIGCIEQIVECAVCGGQLLTGEWNRTDGTGDFIDFDVENNAFIEFEQKHQDCK
jgi:hypothetical protein